MKDPKGQRGLNELFFFAKEICGFRDLSETTHEPICKRISTALVHNRRKAGVVIPRDHFKSSLGLATVLWLFTRAVVLYKNRDWRTLIDTNVLGLSSKHLRWIASQLRGNEEYIRLYGNFCDEDDEGVRVNQREIYISGRNLQVKREPNFMASGIRAEATGNHFDLQWYDDIVSEKNFDTIAKRQIAWEHYEASQFLKEPEALELFTATRWHDADVTGRILKREKELPEEMQSWDWYIKPIWEEEVPLFPERFPAERIRTMQATMSAFMFASQCMNDPVQKEFSIPFDSMTLYLPRIEFPKRLRLKTVTLDPNFRDEQSVGGDNACLIVGAFCQWMKWWGLEVRLGKWTATELIDNLFEINSVYRPHVFKIERKFTSFLAYSIKLRERELGITLPILWIDRDRRPKEVRYTNLEPMFKGGRVRFAAEISERVKHEMEDELTRCGFSAHDDFLDALSDQFAEVNPVFGESDIEEVIIERQEAARAIPKYSMVGNPMDGLEN